MKRHEWFKAWEERNKDKWWMNSDSWNATAQYHATLAEDAAAVFPVKKESPDRLAECELRSFYGINNG